MADFSLLQSSLAADERMRAFEGVAVSLAELPYATLLKLYNPQTVDASALPHLAVQFNVDGLRGWYLADTEQKQRDLIAEAIELNRRAGTPWSIITAMAAVGYPDTQVIENPPQFYDGSWGYNGEDEYAGLLLAGFVVLLDPVRSQVTAEKVRLILALIDEWKPARCALLDLRIGDISLLRNLLLYAGNWQYDGGQTYDGERNL